MCLAMPGKVIAVDAGTRTARVEVFGVPRAVNLSLLEEVRAGDWVLVQAGVAVEKVDEVQAEDTIRLYEEMSAAFEASLTASGEEP